MGCHDRHRPKRVTLIPLHIGFSGSSKPLPKEQRLALALTMEMIETHHTNRGIILHHGDCIHADTHAHAVAHILRWRVIIHPPAMANKRAFCETLYKTLEVRQPKPYLTRNHDIVNESSLLIACPRMIAESLRSGTWSTVRYARLLGRRVIIVRSDGLVMDDGTGSMLPGQLLFDGNVKSP